MNEDEAPQAPRLRKAPAERAAAAVMPAAVLAEAAAEAMHLTGMPGTKDLIVATAVSAAFAWGASGRWKHLPRTLPLSAAAAGGWLTLAAAQGPLAHWPYAYLTYAWAAASLATRWWARGHPSVTSAQERRAQREDWLSHRARRWGLGGSHLVRFERTPLGEEYEIEARGASRIARSADIAELIAEEEGLAAVSRVQMRSPRPRRVKISVRRVDPWAKPALHPLIAGGPDVTLPVPCSIRRPVPVGQDPETRRVLEVPLWDEAGGKNISIVSLKGGGKGVLLDAISERVTAADDAVQIRVNLSVKGVAEPESWGPACHLTAFGPNQKGRAVKVLQVAGQVIEWRAQHYKRGEYAPSPRDPLLVIIADEADSAMAVPQVRKEWDDLATKGREYGVSTVRAAQRGTTDYGSAKTRSQDDVFCVGKVNRQGEIYHAAGSMGFELPDMASYGEGRPGVWAVAELGGGHATGRSWPLGETAAAQGAAVERIARERAFAQPDLCPELREFLGESYEILLSTDVFARWAREQAEAPADDIRDGMDSPLAAIALAVRDGRVQVADPATKDALLEGLRTAEDQALRELDFDMEIDDDTKRRLAAIDAKNNATRQVIAETRAMPRPPDVPPEALAAQTADRWRQVGEQAEIPGEGRTVLLGLLEEGTTASAVAEALGVSKWIARTYLERMRNEGVACTTGSGRGTRWRLADAPSGDAP